MSTQYILALDSETGGLNPKNSDMLTFYATILDSDLKIVDEIDLKLKPDGRLPVAEAGALRVNGIDIQRHLEDPETITYSQARERFVSFIKKYHKKTGRYNNIRPLGQNVDFDLSFIWEYLLDRDSWGELIHYSKIDTKLCVDFLKDSEWLPPELGSLGSVVSFFNIPMGKAHTAKYDTLATVEVYKKLLEMMKSKKEGGQSQDLIALLESE